MWNPNVRPYGEYFAKAQAITTGAVAGNEADNNPQRLDQAQGGTAIRVAVPLADTLVVGNSVNITLDVYGARTESGSAVALGSAIYTNDTGADVTFGADSTICEFVLPQSTYVYPYVSVQIKASAAPT